MIALEGSLETLIVLFPRMEESRHVYNLMIRLGITGVSADFHFLSLILSLIDLLFHNGEQVTETETLPTCCFVFSLENHNRYLSCFIFTHTYRTFALL
jgi:hypothetical protein